MELNPSQEDAPHYDISPQPNTNQEIPPQQNHIIDFDSNVVLLPDKRPTKKPLAMNNYFYSFATSSRQYKGIAYSHRNFLDQVSVTSKPSSYGQASQDSRWAQAMTEELSTLESNNTQDLVPRPNHRKVIGSKWVYRIKHKAHGDIERFKTRLVAKGHTKLKGMITLRLFPQLPKLYQ